MSSRRARPPVTRANLGARRAGAEARSPHPLVPVSQPEVSPTEAAAELSPVEATSDPDAAPVLPDELQQPPVPRLVPVLTPSGASRAVRPFVVAAPAPSPQAGGLLADPALRVARVALARYVRSSWVLVDLVGVVVIWVIAYRGTVTPASFFEAGNIGLILLAILSAYGIVQVVPPSVYLRLVPRRDYRGALGGIVLANALVRAAVALALLLLTLVLHDLTYATAAGVLVGMLGLVANSILIGTLAVVLAPPIAGRVWRVGVLVVVLLALYSYQVSGPLGQALVVTRVVLLPIATCYNLGQTGELGRSGLLALIAVAALVAGMISLAAFALGRRHAHHGSRELHTLARLISRETRLP
jgi:hypothetical protein